MTSSDETISRSSIPQNFSGVELVRSLLKVRIPSSLDLSVLRPPNMPLGQRFETKEDAKARLKADIGRFDEINGLGPIAETLSSCEPREPCASPVCAICSRGYRRWFAAQALRLLRSRDPTFVTILIDVVPRSKLRQFDLQKAKKAAAQRIRRAAPSIDLALGGLEAEYRAAEDAFVIHAHLLVPGLLKHETNALRKAFSDVAANRVVKCQEMRDAAVQVSYLLKFVTYHRPGAQTGSRRARAVPLPDSALKSLTNWRAKYEFMDFVLMMKMRRVGDKLEPITTSRKAGA